jgi:hypothetical protein
VRLWWCSSLLTSGNPHLCPGRKSAVMTGPTVERVLAALEAIDAVDRPEIWIHPARAG